MRDGALVVNTVTNDLGRYRIHNLAPGSYTVQVHFIGFSAGTRAVTVGAGAADQNGVDFQLSPVALKLSAVTVSTTTPVIVDTRTGDQQFSQADYHGPPTSTTSQILQQSIAGAARAPTGEVHIRGQHAEYTYYVDGVPVPPGISGSMNEIFDPEVVNQISFQTGGWDAEYGNKNAAIVNVKTRIPAGGFHLNLGTYAGQFDHSTTTGGRAQDGENLSMSANQGRWGMFLSGARQSSDMRLEPIVYDGSTGDIVNFHNNGQDYYGFGKIQYNAGTHDIVNMDLSYSRTRFQVPYDSTGGVFLDDHQTDVNSFVNLGWRHQFAEREGQDPSMAPQLFASMFFRTGSLDYTPGSQDDPSFVFYPDPTPYNLNENRSFNTIGAKIDYEFHTSRDVDFKFGTTSSSTSGHEDFSATTGTGTQGPASNSGLNGSDIGVYGQTAISPVEWFEVRTGLRYDRHVAPFAAAQTQVSPRVRLNFFPSPATTIYLYYGRLFLPTNVEDLRAITSSALGQDVTPQPTLPERDDFYEMGLVRRLGTAVTAKLSAYYKESSPGIDDNTVPGSAIVTSVNIDQVKVTGLEGVLQFQPPGPVSGYVNVALNHAYGKGPITGGFFPEDTPQGYFDLDHDQRLSIVGSATWAPSQFYASGSVTYGSGLTNGVEPQDCDCTVGTALFDFNKGIHVAPSTVFNASAGYTLVVGSTVLKPQLYIENLFNKTYVLKGAFFSGPAIGRPRSIQLRLNIGM